jgi:hypothetical protein
MVGLSRKIKSSNSLKNLSFLFGLILLSRGGGIRTPGPRKGSPVFKTGAINRSTTPLFNFRKLNSSGYFSDCKTKVYNESCKKVVPNDHSFPPKSGKVFLRSFSLKFRMAGLLASNSNNTSF